MNTPRQSNASIDKALFLHQCLQRMLHDSQVALAYCRQMKLAYKVDALWRQTQTLQTCLRLVDRQENTETVIQTLEATNKLLAEQLKKCLGSAKETGMPP